MLLNIFFNWRVVAGHVGEVVHQVLGGKPGGHLARQLVLEQAIQLHVLAWFSHGTGAQGSQAEAKPCLLNLPLLLQM